MVKHHVLIGLGFKKQNFRNRGIQHILKRASPIMAQFVGGALPQDRMTIMPVSRPPPSFSGTGRRPLKFNY
jgi:hypothetical protein